MRGPQPQAIELTDIERQALQTLLRRHSTPQQLALRARIVLEAADGLNTSQIARLLGINVDTARLWRQRWLLFQPASLDDLSVADRLADAPRPGKPRSFSDEVVCQVEAVACEAPERAGRPISQWTGREIADELKQRGIVEQISDRHAARLLKRGTLNRI
jgi:putative transposase